jgi:hypothetical protein
MSAPETRGYDLNRGTHVAGPKGILRKRIESMERETGIEPATSSLGN